jgi:integrase/recombinase XerD
MATITIVLDDFVADLKRRQFRPNTITVYRSDLRIAGQHLTLPIAHLTLAAIERFLEEGTFAPATRVRRTASLKRFFTWATKQGLCATNPLLSREPARSLARRLPRPIQRTADLEAIDRAITHLTPPYRLIFTILRETGMRIGEVLTLQLADLCLEGGREGLRVRESKNGNERIAPLGAKATPKSLRGLRALVKERKGQAGYVPLFCSNRGTAVSYAAVQYQWAQLCTALGLVDEQGGQHHLRYTIHQLRHTRGSELVRHGQPIEIVQRVLGHRDIRSTQGYAALDDVQVREALERGGQA